jgi:hypothetical protein
VQPRPATATAGARVEEFEHVVLDEDFVRAARVHEASAAARWLESCFQREAATPHAPAAGVNWIVRPSRHFRALRPSSLWLLAGLLTLATVVPTLALR